MKHAIKKRVITYGALTVGLYLALMAFVYVHQSKILFVPEREMLTTPRGADLEYEDLYLLTDDGVRINAWWIPADGQGPVVLFFHGNGGNISDCLTTIRMLHALGTSVLIPDYRGYGNSGGEPSEQGIHLDVQAAWRHLTEDLDIPPGGIVIFGRSFGGAAAAWLSARVRPGGTILESTFTSVPDMGRERYPFLPVSLLSRYSFDTEQQMARMAGPVLIIHSPDDEIIPFSHGERLFEAAPEPKQFLEIRGGHIYGFIESGEPYENALRNFLSSCVECL